MTTPLWKEILPKFYANVQEVYGVKYSVVLLDNLRLHKNIEAARKLLDEDLMELLYFPPNTTHLFQPLDNLVFAKYKSELYKNVRDLDQSLLTCEIEMYNKKLDSVVYGCGTAESRAFSRSTIVESFKNTHMYPFDEEKIREYAAVSVRLPCILFHCPRAHEFQPPVDLPKLAKSAFDAMTQEHRERQHTARENSVVSDVTRRRNNELFTLHDVELDKWKKEQEQAARIQVQIEKNVERERRAALRNLENEKRKRVREEQRHAREEKKRREQLERDARAHQKRVRQEEAAKRERACRCRFAGCSRRWKADQALAGAWYWCDKCGADEYQNFGVCNTHWAQEEGRRLMETHEANCPVRKPKRGKH